MIARNIHSRLLTVLMMSPFASMRLGLWSVIRWKWHVVAIEIDKSLAALNKWNLLCVSPSQNRYSYAFEQGGLPKFLHLLYVCA